MSEDAVTGDRPFGGKALAITSLVLGILGLFTGGLLAIGSLLGLFLGAAALLGRSSRGRDVAWAALAANVLALLTIPPLAAGYWACRQTPMSRAADDDALPEPFPGPAFMDPPPEAPPPPPPRPSTLSATPPPSLSVPPPTEAGAAKSVPSTPVFVGGRAAGQIPEPQKTRDVRPVYPREAKEARVQGVVVLECTISPEGKVVEAKVLRSVPLLDEAAVTAVRQWEYTPTVINGVAVQLIMTVTVNFRLS